MKKLVVITGASSGFGEEMAYLFSRAGHPLLLLARRIEKMKAFNLPNTLVKAVDVTDYDENETFNKWFDGNESEFEFANAAESDKYEPFVGLGVENSLSDYGFYAAIDSYKVYYYDENLSKYNVNVKL